MSDIVKWLTDHPLAMRDDRFDEAATEIERLRARETEQSERIAELYRSEKNSFLSLKGDGEKMAAMVAEIENRKAYHSVLQERLDDRDAEIDRLRAALDTTQALMTANYDAGQRSAAAEIDRLRAVVQQDGAEMDRLQAIANESFRERAAQYRAGMERAAAITVCDACEETIRAEFARPVRKEE